MLHFVSFPVQSQYAVFFEVDSESLLKCKKWEWDFVKILTE